MSHSRSCVYSERSFPSIGLGLVVMKMGRLNARICKPLNVALTFDDGYADHYNIARLLHKHNIRATFFLITGLTQWNTKPLLTLRPKLIQKMQGMNHEIASHTQSHPNLQHLTDEEVHHELRNSKHYLEKLLHQEVEGFAYPYGKYDERISRIVSGYYRYARTATAVDTPSRYELPIRSPGASLRRCSLLMTSTMIRGRGFATILLHSINDLSVRVWIEYLKVFRVRFVTLGELVNAQYG